MQVGRPARWEWAIVGAITLASFVYWCFHFHAFVVPAADTGTYVKTSRELWSGEAPSSYVRMPLFPLLIGLFGKLVPGDQPEIEAALVLNLLLSAGSLLLLYAVARRILGWGAIVPLAMAALAYLTHAGVEQALLEPLIGFMVLLCIWLYARRSRWLTVALFLCGLTRIECAGLIGVVFAVEVATTRRLWRPLLRAALASSGALLWMAASVYSGTRAGHPQLAEMESYGWHSNPAFVVETLRASFAQPDLTYWWIAAAIGVVAAWWRDRALSAVILGFFALYVLAHVLFPVPIDRYVYPVRWVLPLYAALGAEAVIEGVSARIQAHVLPWHRLAIAVLATRIALQTIRFTARRLALADGVAPLGVYALFPAFVLVAVFVFVVLARRPFWAGVTLAFAMIRAVAPQASEWTLLHSHLTWTDYYNYYDDYLAGRWLDEHLASGEKALVTYAYMTATCSHVPYDHLVEFGQLSSSSIDQLPDELRARGISYVVFEFYYYSLPDPSSSMYPAMAREYPPALLEPFAKGRPVPGFERVATLMVPRVAGRADVQIYRVIPPP